MIDLFRTVSEGGMAGEELEVVRLRNDFYRDNFYKVFIALVMLMLTAILVASVSIYLYTHKPKPVRFSADNEFRAFPPVPLDQPYLKPADLIQWVSDALPAMFTYDFVNYSDQFNRMEHSFTQPGWKKYVDQLSLYISSKEVLDKKLFIHATPTGAPFVVNQGLIGDKYGWWVQMPLNINYKNAAEDSDVPVVVQILVIRVSTFNDLSGIAIDNVIVKKGTGSQVSTNG